MTQVKLNRPQAQFLAMPHKFKAFVAGFGSGKTWVGCASLGKHFCEFPRVPAGYFGATYSQIRDIFYPTIDEALHPWGFSVKIKEANKEVEVYQGRRYFGQVICRSMDKPETIIGFKIGKALVDELDVLKMEKARTAWRKIIARLRYVAPGLQNGIDVTTTPEGFKFVHHQFVEQLDKVDGLRDMYGLIQASTYDNELNLPPDYIPSLLASYPEQLISAYINGQFVNLRTGSVYVSFSRTHNSCYDTVEPGEPLDIGMDFNVGKMAGIVHVRRGGLPRAVDEIINAYDTPDMIQVVKNRYWHDGKQCVINVYPDASGNSRKSVNASETDIALLKAAGFRVHPNRSNPSVKDRVNSMNAMFCNAKGERRYLVNVGRCPTYANALEQQAWADTGEPDKTTGHDHPCFPGDTLVTTRLGTYKFEAMPPSGEVLGPHGGWVPYHSAKKTGDAITIRIDFANGYSVECTHNHLFLAGDGTWVEAKDLMGRECVLSVGTRKSLMASCITVAASILLTLFKLGTEDYTELYGPTTSGLSPLGVISTTSTGIKHIIKSRICLVSLRLRTSLGMGNSKLNGLRLSAERTSTRQKSGTGPKRAEHGTETIIEKTSMSYTNVMTRFAHAVGGHSKPLTLLKTLILSFVAKRAKPIIVDRAGLTMLVSSVQNAGQSSKRISTTRVKSVSPVTQDERRDVYCLTVPEYGCFKLSASSPIVSNCDAGGYFISNVYPIVKPTTTVSDAW